MVMMVLLHLLQLLFKPPSRARNSLNMCRCLLNKKLKIQYIVEEII